MATTQTAQPMTDRSGFQRDLLVAIRDNPGASGRALGKQLEQHYGDVTNARLYQNLSTLVEAGFASKRPADDRSDAYRLTEDGRAALDADHAWRDDKPGTVYTTSLENGPERLGNFVFENLDDAAECLVEMVQLKYGLDIDIDVSDPESGVWKWEHDEKDFAVYIFEKELTESADERLSYFRENYTTSEAEA